MMTQAEYEAACKRVDELTSKYPEWDAEWTDGDNAEYDNLVYEMMVYDEKHWSEDVQND